MKRILALVATVMVIIATTLAPAAAADPWFADRPAPALGTALVVGERKGEDVTRIQATPPISGDHPGRDLARLQGEPASAAERSVSAGSSFDWEAAGIGAAFALAIVGAVAGAAVLAGQRRSSARAA